MSLRAPLPSISSQIHPSTPSSIESGRSEQAVGSMRKSASSVADVGVAGSLFHCPEQVYGWIRGAQEECALLDNEWQPTKKELDSVIKAVVEAIDKPHTLQAALSLLGPKYVQQHFPHLNSDPSALDEPFLTKEEQRETLKQVRSLLIGQASQAIDNQGGIWNTTLTPFTEQSQRVISKRLQQAGRMGVDRDGDAEVSISDAAGGALAQIWKRQPWLCNSQISKLQSRIIPPSLRPFVWDRVLLKEKKIEHIEWTLKVLAEKDGIGDLNVSPIANYLQQITSQVYSRTPTLIAYNSQGLRSRTRNVLSRMFFLENSPVAAHVHLLFPLLITFPDDSAETSLSKLEVLMELLCVHNAKAMATAVIDNVGTDLSLHLNLLLQSMEVEDEVQKRGITALIERWIENGLVGILSTATTLFVWDQLFLQNDWRLFEAVCIRLLTSIRHRLMQATTWSEALFVCQTLPASLDISTFAPIFSK